MSAPRRAGLLVGLALALLLAACGGGDRRTLTIFAASSLTDVFSEIGEQFERAHPGVSLRIEFGGSARLRFQLEQGARADLFASADAVQMERARAAGVVLEPTVLFAANQITLITPPSNPAALAGLADLPGSGARVIIAAPDVPAGRVTRELLVTLGLTDAVSALVVSQEDSVRAVLTKVALGEADAGFVWRTDARRAGAGVLAFDVGPHRASGYRIARTSATGRPELAGAFIAFLRSDAAQRILRAAGFLPPPGDAGE